MLPRALLITILLTLSSVNKRVREIGTLKAIGWRQGLVLRQILGESLAQALIGGLLGVAIGMAAAYAISAVMPPLEATSSEAQVTMFGLGAVTPSTQTLSLEAPVTIPLVLLAVGLALVGGLLAGGAGALRAARLRPADALREIG